MDSFKYQDLAVYKLCVEFARRVYDTCGQSNIQPPALRDKILKLAFEVPSHLATGTGKGSKDAYAESVQLCIDAIRECITMIQVFADLGMVDNNLVRPLDEMVRRLYFMLVRLKRSIMGLPTKKKSVRPEIKVAEDLDIAEHREDLGFYGQELEEEAVHEVKEEKSKKEAKLEQVVLDNTEAK